MSGLKKGGEWKHIIYFDPEADKESGKQYLIEAGDLYDEFKKLVDTEEDIVKVYAYKTPLTNYQLTSVIAYHLFIVFETANWWWSIEKDGEGITIQRSKSYSAVQSKVRQQNRSSRISLVKEANGRITVNDLISWLYSEGEVNKEYHYITSNCKTFAKRVFDTIAPNDPLFWYDGAATLV